MVPNVITYTVLISALDKGRQPDQALEVFIRAFGFPDPPPTPHLPPSLRVFFFYKMTAYALTVLL